MTGVDPSLTSTGIAVLTRTQGAGNGVHRIPGRIFLTTETLRVERTGDGPLAEAARVAEIVDMVCRSAHGSQLILVEGLALASRTGKYAERAHLYYSLVAAFAARRWHFDTIAPTTLKKRVTGNGRASKDAVLTAVRDMWTGLGWTDGRVQGRSDRADAAALAWIAAGQMGWCLDRDESPTGVETSGGKSAA